MDNEEVSELAKSVKLAIERVDLDRISELVPLYQKYCNKGQISNPLCIAIEADQVDSLIHIMEISFTKNINHLVASPSLGLSFAIIKCIELKRYEILHAIVDKYKDKAKTILMEEAKRHLKLVDFNELFDPIENYDLTDVLTLAIKNDDIQFIDKYVTNDIINSKNNILIKTAIELNNISIAKLLISFGATIDSNLLEIAINTENVEMTELILDHNPESILILQRQNEPQDKIINLLISRGADPNKLAVHFYNRHQFTKSLNTMFMLPFSGCGLKYSN